MDSSEFNDSSYEGDTLSIYTIKNFVKKDQPYISLNLMILTEYCSGETLKSYLSQRKAISKKDNFDIFSQIVNGVITIHGANIIHRDLKPENIFLDEVAGNKIIKIGDFGLAKAF